MFYSKIPEHIKAIVDGNAAISKSDQEARKELQVRFESTRDEDSKRFQDQIKYLADRHIEAEKTIFDSFDRSQKILERIVSTKTNALGVRIEDAERKIDGAGSN